MCQPEFPIWTYDSCIVRFSCPRHNEFATRAGPQRDRVRLVEFKLEIRVKTIKKMRSTHPPVYNAAPLQARKGIPAKMQRRLCYEIEGDLCRDVVPVLFHDGVRPGPGPASPAAAHR